MGYTTEFYGEFKTNKPVTEEFMNYINRFANVRHMKRDVEKIKEVFPDWELMGFYGDLGKDGEYFIGGRGFCGQEVDESVVNHNGCGECPSLWCQWQMPNANTLDWDGGEKFYEYTEWLGYLIENFFEPKGYVLNGSVEWQGEDYNDFGMIEVKDNIVSENYGFRVMSMSEFETERLIWELEARGYKVTKGENKE